MSTQTTTVRATDEATYICWSCTTQDGDYDWSPCEHCGDSEPARWDCVHCDGEGGLFAGDPMSRYQWLRNTEPEEA